MNAKEKINDLYGKIISSDKIEEKITACFWNAILAIFFAVCANYALSINYYVVACILIFITALFVIWFFLNLIK